MQRESQARIAASERHEQALAMERQARHSENDRYATLTAYQGEMADLKGLVHQLYQLSGNSSSRAPAMANSGAGARGTILPPIQQRVDPL